MPNIRLIPAKRGRYSGACRRLSLWHPGGRHQSARIFYMASSGCLILVRSSFGAAVASGSLPPCVAPTPNCGDLSSHTRPAGSSILPPIGVRTPQGALWGRGCAQVHRHTATRCSLIYRPSMAGIFGADRPSRRHSSPQSLAAASARDGQPTSAFGAGWPMILARPSATPN